MEVISVNNLEKKYGKHFSLKIPSLSLYNGDILGLVGPNGAGKSTTMNVLMGIIKPTSGIVKILGNNINTDNIIIKRRIGVLPERLGHFEQLTGEEQLYFNGKIYGLSANEISKRSTELVELLDLGEIKNEFIYKYSNGTKKKLAFACAIIHRPDILLLDEPLEGIDPICTVIIKDIVRTMVDKGSTVVITSHNLDNVEKLCQEVAILNKGTIIYHSRTENIRKKIKNEINQETYQSLEEIFIDMISNKSEDKRRNKLSWL